MLLEVYKIDNKSEIELFNQTSNQIKKENTTAIRIMT